MRKSLHEEMGSEARQLVNQEAGRSGMADSGEKVKSWQEMQVGSGGGYAAVRPQKKTYHRKKGRKQWAPVGYVTNALENGHKIRKPKGGKGYRPRIRVSYVNGYHFYARARAAMEAKMIRLGEQFLDKIAQRLEGG